MKKYQDPVIVTAIVLCLLAAPEAFAAFPFAQTFTNMNSDLTTWLTPLGALGIIVVAVLAAFTHISWMLLTGIGVFCLGLFGHDQLITWMRSIAGI